MPDILAATHGGRFAATTPSKNFHEDEKKDLRLHTRGTATQRHNSVASKKTFIRVASIEFQLFFRPIFDKLIQGESLPASAKL